MLSSLASDRTRIAVLDSHISALEETLLFLKTERQALQTRLDAYAYPVLTLPNEIVSHIFVDVLPPYPVPPPLFGPLSPTALGHICHQWREIAFSTPLLWRASSFVVRKEWNSDRAFKRGAELFELWVARAGSLPLSIQFKDEQLVSSWIRNPFVLAILPHLAHVEHLDLFCRPNWSEFPVDRPLPLLRNLRVYIGRLGADSASITAFNNAIRLRSVHLTRLQHLPHVQLPWHQLTSLALESCSRDCVHILSQAINLVHCRLDLDSRSAIMHSMNPLTRLESLEIHSPSTYLLRYLTLPVLRSVKVLDGYKIADLRCVDSLLECTARSGCSLQKLHVLKGPNSGDYLTHAICRAKFPSVPTILFDAVEDPEFDGWE